MEDAVTRLELSDVTSRRMFGGLCYYADNKTFAFVIGRFLALKLSKSEIRAAVAGRDGKPFEPAKGFVMREYLALSESALAEDSQLDTYILASYRFVMGQGGDEDPLGEELRRGRRELYRMNKAPKRVILPEE
jgi:TfoX/Sxy family transcriptional regulator of competence genes